jgi:molybdopterin synthase sulfur carrier subunit
MKISIKVFIKYFASIRETLERGQETMETSAHTVAELRDELIARGGAYATALARGKAVRVAVQQTMCDETTVLEDGAEVAFFPPVTGG